MTWRVEFSRSAQKQIRKLDPQTRNRIQSFIFDRLIHMDDPRDLGKALTGQRNWRYRVGDYRLISEIEDDRLLIVVIAVAHRRSVYR